MKWLQVDSNDPENVPVLGTGFCYGDSTKGRWFTVMTKFSGEWFEEETGDTMFPPTHYMILEGPKDE